MHQKSFEFVTFRAFRAHVPYVVPTCLTYLYVSRAYVPTCLRASNYYVLTCLGTLNYYVAMCLRALNYYVPTWLRACVSFFFTCLYILACQYKFFAAIYLRALNYFLSTSALFSRDYVPSTTYSLLHLVLLFFSRLFDLSSHSIPQNKASCF